MNGFPFSTQIYTALLILERSQGLDSVILIRLWSIYAKDIRIRFIEQALIKLAYNNNHAKSSVWAISGQFNVLPFGEITAAMGG